MLNEVAGAKFKLNFFAHSGKRRLLLDCLKSLKVKSDFFVPLMSKFPILLIGR